MWFLYIGDNMVPSMHGDSLDRLLVQLSCNEHYGAVVAAGKAEIRWASTDARPALGARDEDGMHGAAVTA